ncbi:MAG: RNA polymerase sigma factor [Phycisphaerales bacterium]
MTQGAAEDLRPLLRRSRRGDEAAARALLAACAPSMRLYARSILHDHDLAEDAVQAALLAVFYSTTKRIDAVDDPRAWLLAVTRKKAASMARADTRRRTRESTLSMPQSTTPAHDSHNSVRDAIALLPRRWREAVILTDGCGLTLDRAAEAMHANRNTVAWWRRRAHALLRHQLTPLDDPQSRPATEVRHG